jgi:hypothetical protein
MLPTYLPYRRPTGRQGTLQAADNTMRMFGEAAHKNNNVKNNTTGSFLSTYIKRSHKGEWKAL